MSRAKKAPAANAPNAMRGERAVQIGGKSFVVALTMEKLAKLETAFDTPSFESIWPKLGSVTGEGKDRCWLPSATALLTFWRVVLEDVDYDHGDLQRTNPTFLMIQAMTLRVVMAETWFAGDAPSGGSGPL